MTNLTSLGAAGAIGLLGLLAACDRPADTPTAVAAPTSNTLAAAISGDKQSTKLAAALRDSGLATVLDGAGAYTIIAPRDAAFSANPAKVTALLAPENRAALVALLRAHIVPGYLTPEDIGKAIDAQQGRPVTMRTMGDGKLAFTRTGDAIIVTAADGAKATLGTPALRATNGVAIPVDGLLRKL